MDNREQYSSSRHTLGFYYCVVNTCRYSIHNVSENAKPLDRLFKQALEDVVLLLPSLRVGIKDEASKVPKFVRMDSMRLSDHIQWRRQLSEGKEQDRSTLLQIVQTQHQTHFPNLEQQPPWRVTCVESTPSPTDATGESTAVVDVVFATHHAIADGAGTTIFHAQLLEALSRRLSTANSAQSTNGEKDMSLPNTVGLEPPLEKVLDFKVSWSFLLSVLWQDVMPNWLHPRQRLLPWTGEKITLNPSQVNIRLIQFPSEAVTGLLTACRARKTTLTALIHAIALSSLSRHVPEDQAKKFVASTPINLRPFMDLSTTPSTRNLMGPCVTSCEHIFDEPALASMRSQANDPTMLEVEIWSVARTVKSDLQRRLAQIPVDDQIGLMPYVSDWRQRWKSMLGHARKLTWEVSNLGSMFGRPTFGETSVMITQSTFTQSAMVAGPAFSVNLSSIRDAGLMISLCWQESIVKTDLMETVAGELESWLGTLQRSKLSGNG